MTIRQLKTLIKVADTKTFSEAAHQINLTHAAVGQQMHALEAQLDLKIFDRATRTPTLTPSGVNFVERARQVVADYERLVQSAHRDDDLPDEIRLGALGTTLTGLTPRAMALLREAQPSVRLHVKPGLTSELLRELERGNLDAAVITRPHQVPRHIDFMELASESLQLIVAKGDPERNALTLLRDRPFIRFNRNAVLGTLIDNWLVENDILVSETMELDSAEAISSMVEANLGVSIVPDLCIRAPGSENLRRLDLGQNAPSRTLGLACRTAQTNTQTIKVTIEAFRRTIETG